jgi:hypothetical protein
VSVESYPLFKDLKILLITLSATFGLCRMENKINADEKKDASLGPIDGWKQHAIMGSIVIIRIVRNR